MTPYDGLRLTVLGCDGSWPGPGGATSGYLVRTRTTNLLVDAGTGVLARLQQHIRPNELDAVVITHSHPDHCIDVTALDVLLALSHADETRLCIYAPAGVREQVFPGVEPISQLVWTEIEDGDELEIGDVSLRTARTDHGPVTLGLRISHDESVLVYGADSGPGFDMGRLGPDIDVALVDSAEPAPNTAPGHCNESTAAAMAADAGAARLMLTHIRPGHDRQAMRQSAARQFRGEVLLAEAGFTYTI